MKTALAITAALASPVFAEPCKPATGDVHVTLHGTTTVTDVVAFGKTVACTNLVSDYSVRFGSMPRCSITVIAPATLTAAGATELFLAVLAKMQLTVVPKGNRLRVVPADLHRTPLFLPAVLVIPPRCTPVTLEFRTRVSQGQPLTPPRTAPTSHN